MKQRFNIIPILYGFFIVAILVQFGQAKSSGYYSVQKHNSATLFENPTFSTPSKPQSNHGFVLFTEELTESENEESTDHYPNQIGGLNTAIGLLSSSKNYCGTLFLSGQSTAHESRLFLLYCSLKIAASV